MSEYEELVRRIGDLTDEVAAVVNTAASDARVTELEGRLEQALVRIRAMETELSHLERHR